MDLLQMVKQSTRIVLLCLLVIFIITPASKTFAEGEIYKVLPHLLDQKGRHTVSPSLFERDAYQEFLRENPALVSGIGYDIHWKCPSGHKRDLQIILEIRGSNNYQASPTKKIIKAKAKKYFKTWSRIKLSKKEMKTIGKIVAWKVSLVEGDKTLTEHFSFLWKNPPKKTPGGTSESRQPEIGPRNRRGFPRQ